MRQRRRAADAIQLARRKRMSAARRAARIPRRQIFEDAHDAIGIGVGQRTEPDRIQSAEDGGGRADAEGECDDRGGGESRAAREAARAIRHVLPEIRDPAKCPGIALKFFGLLDTAEGAPRRQPRRIRRHAVFLKLLFEQRQVRRDLARQVVLGSIVTHGRNDSLQKPPQARHGYDSSSNLSTRPASRRHFSASFCSAFSPAFVSA